MTSNSEDALRREICDTPMSQAQETIGESCICRFLTCKSHSQLFRLNFEVIRGLWKQIPLAIRGSWQNDYTVHVHGIGDGINWAY